MQGGEELAVESPRGSAEVVDRPTRYLCTAPQVLSAVRISDLTKKLSITAILCFSILILVRSSKNFESSESWTKLLSYAVVMATVMVTQCSAGRCTQPSVLAQPQIHSCFVRTVTIPHSFFLLRPRIQRSAQCPAKLHPLGLRVRFTCIRLPPGGLTRGDTLKNHE